MLFRSIENRQSALWAFPDDQVRVRFILLDGLGERGEGGLRNSHRPLPGRAGQQRSRVVVDESDLVALLMEIAQNCFRIVAALAKGVGSELQEDDCLRVLL